MNKMNFKKYLYCPNCGWYWISTIICNCDIECLNCKTTLFDGNIEIITKVEYEELKQREIK